MLYNHVAIMYVVPAETPEHIAAFVALLRAEKAVFGFVPRAAFEVAAQKNGLLIALTPNGTVIGGIHFHHRRDRTTTLHDLVVAPSARHTGVGRALMTALENAARDNGQITVRLKCPGDNPANAFYSRLGFRQETVEPGKRRPVVVWSRAVPARSEPTNAAPVKREAGSGSYQFFASLTNNASDIRQLMNRFYAGYDNAPPFHPFARVIFTPLFSSGSTVDLFRNLASASPDPEANRVPTAMPRPVIMLDSGGYQVQMGKLSYGELVTRLREMMHREPWGDYYVLPDHVPLSSDTDAEAAQKARETLDNGENFVNWFPERVNKFVGVVHGRTEAEMYRGAKHWAALGVHYIAFGAFGTSGPNGSVNVVSKESLALLQSLSQAAKEEGQRIHVFGIGHVKYLAAFKEAKVNLGSYDSAGWWKMGVFGFIFGGKRYQNVCDRGRMTRPASYMLRDFEQIGHVCPFCDDTNALMNDKKVRVLHNLCFYTELVSRLASEHGA